MVVVEQLSQAVAEEPGILEVEEEVMTGVQSGRRAEVEAQNSLFHSYLSLNDLVLKVYGGKKILRKLRNGMLGDARSCDYAMRRGDGKKIANDSAV